MEKTKSLIQHHRKSTALSPQSEPNVTQLYVQLIELWQQYETAIIQGFEPYEREVIRSHISLIRHELDHLEVLSQPDGIKYFERRLLDRRQKERRGKERRRGAHRIMLP